MLAARHRALNAAVVLAVLGSGVAFVWVTWGQLFPGDPDIDCDSYVFPAHRWRMATYDEAWTRQAARDVVRCELVMGKTRREVRSLLGPPRGDRGRRWSYEVGTTGRYGDSDVVPVALSIEFHRGRVVSVSAPSRRPGGGANDLRDQRSP